MSIEKKRRKLAEEASELLQDARTNLRTLSEEAGISYPSLRTALTESAAGRVAALPDYLLKLAEALERKGKDLQKLSDDLKKLATEAKEE